MGLLDLRELDGSTAILGGSFDPVHLGHLHIASQVLYWSRVSKVLFIPNGNHHFKKGLVRLSFADRYALVKKAIACEPRFAISDADRAGSGFTADLLQDIMKENPQTRYVFIIGSDNLPGLPKWHNYKWLVKNVHFLLLPRPGYQIDMSLIANLKISIIPIELSEVSSTAIRERIDSGQSIEKLVPADLEAKITELYLANPPKLNHVAQE